MSATVDFENVAARSVDGRPMVAMTIVLNGKLIGVAMPASKAQWLLMKLAAAADAAIDLSEM